MLHQATDDDAQNDDDTRGVSPFGQPGTTTAYDIAMQYEGEGRMGWTVREAPSDRVTVVFHYEVGDRSFETTLTGTDGTITDELLATPARPFLTTVLFPSVLLVAEGDALRVGDRRPFSMPGYRGDGCLEITGTDSHVGIEGVTTTWRVDDTLRYEDCVALAPGILLAATYYARTTTEAFMHVQLTTHRVGQE